MAVALKELLDKSYDRIITMTSTVKADLEGPVGIRGRKTIGALSKNVLLELGFEGCIRVQ